MKQGGSWVLLRQREFVELLLLLRTRLKQHHHAIHAKVLRRAAAIQFRARQRMTIPAKGRTLKVRHRLDNTIGQPNTPLSPCRATCKHKKQYGKRGSRVQRENGYTHTFQSPI